MLQLAQGQCDGDGGGFRPARRLGAGLIEQPAAEFEDDFRFFGAGHELVGGEQAETVMPQPDQSLRAKNLAGGERHQRLVVQQQVPGGEGLAQAARDPAAFSDIILLYAALPCRAGWNRVKRGSRRYDGPARHGDGR